MSRWGEHNHGRQCLFSVLETQKELTMRLLSFLTCVTQQTIQGVPHLSHESPASRTSPACSTVSLCGAQLDCDQLPYSREGFIWALQVYPAHMSQNVYASLPGRFMVPPQALAFWPWKFHLWAYHLPTPHGINRLTELVNFFQSPPHMTDF